MPVSTVVGIDFHQISENISGRETGWNGATDDHGLARIGGAGARLHVLEIREQI